MLRRVGTLIIVLIIQMGIGRVFSQSLPFTAGQTWENAHILDSIVMFANNSQSLRDMKVSIDTITRLVNALKSYTHLDQAEMDEVDIHEGLETNLTILHNQLRHGITVVKKFSPLPKMNCYVNQLNQVWTSILQNSIQAMGGKGEIVIETYLKDPFVGVKITKSLRSEARENVMIIESETVPESFIEAIVEFDPTHILLFDAGSFGGKPGETKLVYPTKCSEPAVSSHLLPLSLFCNYLQLALEAKIAMVIIQPKTTDFGEGLSTEVEKTAVALKETLLSLLT